jgi:Protein of unknown function (DUF499)
MATKLSWTPWHKVVTLRADVRTGALSLADFAADLYDVVMQKGARPIYEDPAHFFALTYPTFSLRELAKDVVGRLAGKNTKAIRQLELTYGGGKTHTLITLRHLANEPASLPDLPAVKEFISHVGGTLPSARVVALCFDKLDVEKGMEVRGPKGELRWLKHPWSVLAFQIAGADGLRALQADNKDEERETPPAEPLLVDLLSRPQKENRSTLVLIDEVLMYAREKVGLAEVWRGRLIDFFQYLCQAVSKVDRCAMVVSLLASDPEKNDPFGKQLIGQIFEVFNRQKEEGVQPVQKEDVAEVLRRRFFEPSSIANLQAFRPYVTTAVANIADVDEHTKKDRKNAEERFFRNYPFHPDLTDIFYSRWTQLDSFQRTRGILRTFALALRDAEQWDDSPLVAANVFLPRPDKDGIAEAARELTGIATHEVTEGHRNDWTTVLEGELEKARTIQSEQPGLKFREIEQAVCTTFLSSQPIGQKARTTDLLTLIGATKPDRIELEKGLRRWTELSWFLDEAEFAEDITDPGQPRPLPKAWRLGNRPNLKQMHHDACSNRVTAEMVEMKLLGDVQQNKGLTQGATAAGARVHTLPERPRDIEDDGDFHFGVLGPKAASESGKPSAEARRFIDETTAADRPRVFRNAVVLVCPSRDGLDAARARIREHLGWEEVRTLLKDQAQDPIREDMLASWTEQARKRIPEAIRQAWSIVVTVNEQNDVHAFKITPGTEPLFATVKADKRSRIQDTAISAEAMLPGGPYDLWRSDEPSRRVKDLLGAFAQIPKLPKMLRQKEILDTIEQGVRDGIFIAKLTRPDKSARTFWRTHIDEASRKEPALELFLPETGMLSELWYQVLAPSVLPGLWKNNVITVADIVSYFAGGRSEVIHKEGYDESVAIPACPAAVVETAVSEAVSQGLLWLVHGPASFQGEPVPAGVLTPTAQLLAPLPPISVDQLMPDALPDAWKDGQTSAYALAVALSAKVGRPLPWAVVRRAIDDALKARWIEIPTEGAVWPCEMAAASKVLLRVPKAGSFDESAPVEHPSYPKGARHAEAVLEPLALQDFVEALPEILKAAAGVPLELRLQVVIGNGQDLKPATVDALNKLLEEVSPALRLMV